LEVRDGEGEVKVSVHPGDRENVIDRLVGSFRDSSRPVVGERVGASHT
jgi:hypothetical protein